MTLPYPLLARGKIIDTDMEDLVNQTHLEIQVRDSSIKMQIPNGLMPDMDVDTVISRADKIAKYILKGNVPKVGEPVYTSNWGADPTRELYGHDESTGEPIYVDDDFHQDADGILTLTKNMPQMGYANPN